MIDLPEVGTMAAELVGDAAELSDDRLRQIQAFSDTPNFRCTGLASDFEAAGIDRSWLVVTKKGWSMPEVGRIGHAIARLPLLWTALDARTLSNDSALTSEFTGFKRPFTPTIAQRLSAALGILNIQEQQEAGYGTGIIRKCQEDIASILIRFPVLMHTAFRSINYQGPRQSPARVPLSYALQKATHSRLPSKAVGVDAKSLRSFANHPVVRFALTTPLTHAQLADCGPWQEILKNSYQAGPLCDVAHARFTFAIDAHHLDELVDWKRGERRYSLFLDTSQAAGFQDSLAAKNDSTMQELIAVGLIQDLNKVPESLGSIRSSFPPVTDPKALIKAVCAGVRSHNRFTGCQWDQVIGTTHKAIQVAGVQVGAATIAAHFLTSLNSVAPNEPVDTGLLASAVSASGTAGELRNAIGGIGASASPLWDEALSRIELAEQMTATIEASRKEAIRPATPRQRASL